MLCLGIMFAGLALANGQTPTQLLTHSHLSGTGGENRMRKLVGQDRELQHLEHLLPLLLLSPRCSQGYFSHFSPHPSLPGSVLSFLTQAFPEAPTRGRGAQLRPAVGPLEPAGTGCVQVRHPQPLLTEEAPQPLLPAPGHLHPVHQGRTFIF